MQGKARAKEGAVYLLKGSGVTGVECGFKNVSVKSWRKWGVDRRKRFKEH